MVYISSWQEYQEAAEALYEKSPNTTRYCVKWRNSVDGGKLVLKITDDTTCLKFKTHSSIFLNRFDALNLSLMQKMQNRQPAQASAAVPQAQPSDTTAKESISQPAAPTVAGPSSGGVKKKKPKKKR
ncbi:Signal recognition particle protein [Grifola frondosa]|uniref:Signal recognition particle protein n=1 Tax=Grifola frondosa TaxID=5627 RepID=A0A1C7MD95_GRIFR|nr:Signal recognition particle protein [Grifola frondosa]